MVHHALINVLGPFFERRYIFDSDVCHKGKGQHAALKRAEKFVRCNFFYLKMDIRKFYDTMNPVVLSDILQRQIKDRRVLELFDCISTSYCTVEGQGLPLGNLTRQYLGNISLDQFDHWMKEYQQCRCYLRYMGDMLCLGTQTQMRTLRDASVEWFREKLCLDLNHCGEINRVSKGIPFLGQVLHPQGTRRVQRSEHRLRSKFRRLEQQVDRELVSPVKLTARCGSLFAGASYGNTIGLRRFLANTSRFGDA